MNGGTTQTQNQSQQSQTNPWGPAVPMLNSIIGQLGAAPTGATSGQTGAVNTINSEASGLPSFAPQATNAVTNLFGSNTTPQQGMLTGAYNQARGTLSPMLGADYTNPYTNPALSSAMGTMNSDITNQINSEFAAAGRPVGTNADSAQALARGLSQGEGGLLANEFNTLTQNQIGAANALPTIAGNTASGITTQEQVPLENAVQGISATSALPGIATQPGTTALTAANLQAGLPTANLGSLESLLDPIAAMGGTSSGTSTGTVTQQGNLLSNILGGVFGGMGMLGGTGAFGSSGYLNPSSAAFMFSDERVKEDIEPVGMLYDDTPVFSYRYKGDPTPRIGLIAQDIEQRRPDAVVEFGGIKAVDYGKATERARALGGMLDDFALAA